MSGKNWFDDRLDSGRKIYAGMRKGPTGSCVAGTNFQSNLREILDTPECNWREHLALALTHRSVLSSVAKIYDHASGWANVIS